MNGNLSNTNGITLSPDPHVGFKCTCFDKSANVCFEIKINGQDGILMYTLNSRGEPKTYMFKAEPDGNLLVNGVVYAKDLCLGGINNQSVIEYIDINTGKKATNYIVDEDGVPTSPDIISALKGKNISCAGLYISDGTSMFRVNSDATVEIVNGEIEMSDSRGNRLYIDSGNFIRWVVGGEDKFYYDSGKNSIVFRGNIEASNLYGSKYFDDTGSSYFMIGGEISPGMGDFTIYRAGDSVVFQVYDNGDSISLKAQNTSLLTTRGVSTTIHGIWRDSAGYKLATEKDIENLKNLINPPESN